MLSRIPEPELMEDAVQAAAYAAADFSEANGLFERLWREHFPDWSPLGRVLDLGCGPADIPLRFARRLPDFRVDGVDGAEAMLALARSAWGAAGLGDRARWIRGRIPDVCLPDDAYDAVMSNSLLHHLSDPDALWRFIKQVAVPGASLLVMDLKRPADPLELEALVSVYAAGAPPVLLRDFQQSLHAAYTPDEVRSQLDQAHLSQLRVSVVSDRHLAVGGRLERQSRET